MRAVLVLALVLFATPAFAAAAGKPPAKAGDQGPPRLGNRVEMPILVAPMTVDGKLQSYAYLNPVIEAGSTGDMLKIRDKTPFLQDAFIRDVNGAPIVEATDPAKIDVPGLKARLLADARRLLGMAAVKALGFAKIEITPLTPGQPNRRQAVN